MRVSLRILSMLVLLALPVTASWALHINDKEAMQIGGKIWHNEGNGKVKYMLWWNQGEEFASLGIGHFIWYPKGQKGPYNEIFPQFLKFAQKKQARLPFWLKNSSEWYLPWNTREEFLQQKNDPAALALQSFLLETIPLQVEFMANRLHHALPKLIAAAPKAERVQIRRVFNLLASMPEGRYVLMDYVNFKGEGILKTERYQGQGWGLLQVLQNMKDVDETNVLPAFVASAKAVLAQRVKNAPPQRKEQRWTAGWNKRLETYIT